MRKKATSSTADKSSKKAGESTDNATAQAAADGQAVQNSVEGSDITLVHVTQALNLLTLEDVRKLSGIVLAELRKRAAPVRATDEPRIKGPRAVAVPVTQTAIPQVKPANQSPEWMAAMRAAKAAKSPKHATVPAKPAAKQDRAAKLVDPVKEAQRAEYLGKKAEYAARAIGIQCTTTGKILKRRFNDAKEAAEHVRELVALMKREYVLVSLQPSAA